MFDRFRWPGLVWTAAIGLAWAAVAPRAHAEGAALKIGVVNITKVFDNYKKKRALEEDLRTTREQKSRVLREKENEVKRLADEIKMLELGSEARKGKEEEYEKKQVELRSFTQVTAGNLTEQKREITEKLYAEIAKAVGDYGRKNQFDLIIKWEDVEMQSATMDELLFKISQRTVLFVSEKADITQDIINIVNNQYSKEIIEK